MEREGSLTPRRRSPVREHPFLALYLAALAVVWVVTIATWTVRSGQVPLDRVPEAASGTVGGSGDAA